MKQKSESQLEAELAALNAKCESQKQDIILAKLAARDARLAVAKELSQRAKNMLEEGCSTEQIATEIQRLCAARPESKDDIHAKIRADLVEAGRKYGLTERDFQ